MRPSAQSRAECAADEGRDHADVLSRYAKDGGDLLRHIADPLGLVPQRQALALPGGNGGVQLDRIVVLARDGVGLFDLDLGSRERAIGVTAPGLGRLV